MAREIASDFGPKISKFFKIFAAAKFCVFIFFFDLSLSGSKIGGERHPILLSLSIIGRGRHASLQCFGIVLHCYKLRLRLLYAWVACVVTTGTSARGQAGRWGTRAPGTCAGRTGGNLEKHGERVNETLFDAT